MFMPGKVTVGLGETVTWTFPEATSHTSTSDQGFWDSGTKTNGATYSRAFTSAGRFAYHCTFHSTMRGSVGVPVPVTAPSEIKRVDALVDGQGRAAASPSTCRSSAGPGRGRTSASTPTKAARDFKPADAGQAVQGPGAHLAGRRGLGLVEAGASLRLGPPSP